MRAQNGGDVLLVDADSQRSAMDFAGAREQAKRAPSFCCVGLSGTTIGDEFKKISQKFQDIIVDVGGRDTPTLRKALLAADVVVIPFIPSQLDVWGLERMNDIVGEALQFHDKLRVFSIINKADGHPRMTLNEEAIAIAKSLSHIPFSGLAIGNRIIYRRCIAEGMAVTEWASPRRDPKAIGEIMHFYEKVFFYEKEKRNP
jgi:chromosome partitioning protein